MYNVEYILSHLLTEPTIQLYRVTYDDVGIYQALKTHIGYTKWKELKDDPRISWLPLSKVEHYGKKYTSYFTQVGYDKFMDTSLVVIEQYLDQDKIAIHGTGYRQSSIQDHLVVTDRKL